MKVYYFSGTGHSQAVAEILAQMLTCKAEPIGYAAEKIAEEVAAVVFPVYSQNIPKPVVDFLKILKAKYVALIATYGKISYGNVLYEAQKTLQGEVIAGAYIPIGHTYLDGDCVFDAKYLLPIAQRMQAPQNTAIPRTQKNPFANIFPGLRSRISVKIIKEEHCNSCGLCEKFCPTGAMRNGRVYRQCIRCLRCVANCPQKALHYKNTRILSRYLNSHRKEEYMVYL